jgi:uncharacterized PurR-regulated membrane protein YhhQ (DUF165 family)
MLLVLLAGCLDFAANWLAAHYLISVGPWIIPAGTLIFSLTFTLYDTLRRLSGRTATIAAIGLGFAASIAYSLMFGGGTGRVAVAGLIALACSGTIDLLMQSITLRWPIWQYVATSNVISLAIDTLVFVQIAFAVLPPSVRLQILEGQYLAKISVMLVSIPLVYFARNRLAVARPAPTPTLAT